MADDLRVQQLLDRDPRFGTHAGRGLLLVPRTAARSAKPLAADAPRGCGAECTIPHAGPRHTRRNCRPAEYSRLRGGGGPRSRRHGDRLQGAAPAPQSSRRPQDAARQRVCRPPGSWRAVSKPRAAEAVASLRHTNIVQLFDVGDHEGRPFFTMEYVEGGCLAHKVEGTPQAARQSAALVATLAGRRAGGRTWAGSSIATSSRLTCC